MTVLPYILKGIVFTCSIKDLELGRLFWIILMGLMQSNILMQKRQKKKSKTKREDRTVAEVM